MSSELEKRVSDAIKNNEDLISAEELDDLMEQFPGESKDAINAIRSGLAVAEVIKNMKENPKLSFHEHQNIYPFPTSDEVRAAKKEMPADHPIHIKRKHHSK